MARVAYTLIEVLAVVALLGLVAGFGIRGIARMADSDPLDRAERRLRDGLWQARARSRGQGPHEFAVRRGRLELRAQAAHEPALRIELPEEVRVRFESADGTELNALAFDARGRSVDAVVVVRDGDRRRRWRYLGLTGQCLPPAEPPP